jgi:hypothetical protein
MGNADGINGKYCKLSPSRGRLLLRPATRASSPVLQNGDVETLMKCRMAPISPRCRKAPTAFAMRFWWPCGFAGDRAKPGPYVNLHPVRLSYCDN